MTTLLNPLEFNLVTPHRFRHVLGHYPTGVTVVTACDHNGRPIGMTVGSFTSVSLEPALVGFLPARTSTTFPAIRDSGSFCVNVVADDQHELCGRFARPAADRFKGLGWRVAPSGSPIINSAVAWIDCSIEAIADAGDHHFVIGRVNALDAQRARRPLLFHRGELGALAPFSDTDAATSE